MRLSFFFLHAFQNVSFQLLGQYDNYNDRLHKENVFILFYRTLYPYSLNTVLNNVNLSNIGYIDNFFLFSDNFTKTNRGKRGSGINRYKYLMPEQWLNNPQDKLSSCPNVKYIKTEIYFLLT